MKRLDAGASSRSLVALALPALLLVPALALAASLASGCSDSGAGVGDAGAADGARSDGGAADAVDAGVAGTHVMMAFSAFSLDKAGTFFDAPFPSDHRLGADGTVSLAGFPQPGNINVVKQTLALLDGVARGFGTTSGVFLRASGDVDATSLPDLKGSTEAGASVYLVSLDKAAQDAGKRYPVYVRYGAGPEKFGATRLLSLLPLQGVPLRPKQRYAAVVTARVRDAAGKPLVAGVEMRELAAGRAPRGLAGVALSRYREALDRVVALGEKREDVVALAVFTTWDPYVGLAAVVTAMKGRALPKPVIAPGGPASGFTRREVFADYCVYEARYAMPVYQTGTPPYLDSGGGFDLGADGKTPRLVREAQARLYLTVPRAPMPAGGWPTVVFIRTGGGGDRPLVDRGRRATSGGTAAQPGSGPALELARAGFAGVSIDGPHGGPLRNANGGDEQILIFNISNPAALRDNLRQSAAELTLMPAMLGALSLDLSDCALAGAGGGGTARYQLDKDKIVLMGHSMGATIAPLTMAEQPAYRALILSGGGGSWIENVLFKLKPLAVRPIAEALVRGKLHRHEPFLNLLQWVGEPADPPVYARRITGDAVVDGKPRDVLMLQGIVDRYILPPIANALSLALGLDLGGTALDGGHTELTQFAPLADVVGFGGGKALALPLRGNRAAGAVKSTAVVVQHAEDGVEDGHEIAFQRPEPKHQYRCFLAAIVAGEVPVVAKPSAAAGAVCPKP